LKVGSRGVGRFVRHKGWLKKEGPLSGTRKVVLSRLLTGLGRGKCRGKCSGRGRLQRQKGEGKRAQPTLRVQRVNSRIDTQNRSMPGQKGNYDMMCGRSFT